MNKFAKLVNASYKETEPDIVHDYKIKCVLLAITEQTKYALGLSDYATKTMTDSLYTLHKNHDLDQVFEGVSEIYSYMFSSISINLMMSYTNMFPDLVDAKYLNAMLHNFIDSLDKLSEDKKFTYVATIRKSSDLTEFINDEIEDKFKKLEMYS